MRHTGSKEELHFQLTVLGKHRFSLSDCFRPNIPALDQELPDGLSEGDPLWEEKVLSPVRDFSRDCPDLPRANRCPRDQASPEPQLGHALFANGV